MARVSAALRRNGARVLRSAALAITFSVALICGALIHSNLPMVRTLAATAVCRALDGVFYGQLRVSSFDRITPTEVVISGFDVRDEHGETVLTGDQLSVHLDLLGLVKSLLFDSDTLNVVVPHLRLEKGDVRILFEKTGGGTTLARAFSTKAKGSTASKKPKRNLLIWFSNIEIGQALAHIETGKDKIQEARANHAQGRLLISPNQITIDVDRCSLGATGIAGHEIQGTGTANLTLPGAITVDFHGFFADVELQAHARQRADRISFELDVPQTAPHAVASLIPAWPLKVPASLHAEAQGDWSKLTTNLDLQFSGASMDLDGTVQLEPTPAASFQIFAHDLDLRAVAPEAPETALTVSADVDIQKTQETLVAKFSANTEPTSIVGQRVPRFDVAGSFDQRGLDAEARIFEPGAPMTAQLTLSKSNVLEIHAKLPNIVLGDWDRTSKLVTGNAAVTLDAKLEKNRLSASLNANLLDISSNQFHLRRGTLKAQATGNLDQIDQIEIHSTLDGSDFTRGQLAFSTAQLKVNGRWQEPHIDVALADSKERRCNLHGDVALKPHPRLHDVEIELLQHHLALRGKILELDPEAGLIDVRDISMSGQAGTLSGYLRFKPGLLETELSGEQLDLAQLALALGLSPSAARGKARIQINLVAGRDVTRGSASIVLEQTSIAGFGSATLRLTGALHDRDISGDISGIDPLLGSFAAQWNGELAGAVLDSKSWTEATGTIEFRDDGIPLAPLRLALGPKSPLVELDGQAFTRVLLQRTAVENPPNLFVEAGVSDLTFAIKAGAEKYGLNNASLHTNLNLNAKNGDLTAALLLGDASGDLLSASGAMRLDLQRLLENPDQAWPLLRSTPLDVVLSLEPHELRRLPPPLQVSTLRGTASARIALRGSLEKPSISATLLGNQISGTSSGAADALDAKAQIDYSPLESNLNAKLVLTNQEGQVADLLVVAKAPWPGNPESEPVSGQMDATLKNFPLGTVGVLADNAIQGKLDGSIHTKVSAGAVETQAEIATQDLRVGHTTLGGGTLFFNGGNDQLTGQLRLASPASSIVANVQVKAPAMKRLESLSVDVDAKGLEASLLAPLLTGVVNSPSGQLDARAAFQLDRSTTSKAATETWESRLNGTAELKNGMAHIEALGLELRDVGWSASARSAGSESLISFSQIRAKARSAKPNITGNASLTLRGIEIVSGAATLHLDDVPLTMQGVPKGWGTGNVQATLTRKPEQMLVEVAIPEFLTRLPQSTGRDLIDLKDNPDFNVLQLETKAPEEPGIPWHIVIKLGERVRVTRSDVNISVTGSPTIDLTDTSRLSGNVELTPGGRVQAIGKVFQIERGSVRLNPEDPENPQVDIRASWRDPEGATLYIGVHGMLKDLDELEFSSDAGLSKEEIWERLVGVGGSSTATGKEPEDSGNNSAVGRVGAAGVGAAALGLNELFGGSLRDVEIRLDPGQNASYTAAVRLNDKLWLEGSYQHNDTTITFGEPSNVVTGALDYRFMRNWSLRTELGNAGGTVDLLWQRRY